MAAEESEREGGALRRREEPAAQSARKEPGNFNRSGLASRSPFPTTYVTIGQLLLFPAQSPLSGKGGVRRAVPLRIIEGDWTSPKRNKGVTLEIKGLYF